MTTNTGPALRLVTTPGATCLVGDTECCDVHAMRAYGRLARPLNPVDPDDDLVDFGTW